jgi:hypothetical protein
LIMTMWLLALGSWLLALELLILTLNLGSYYGSWTLALTHVMALKALGSWLLAQYSLVLNPLCIVLHGSYGQPGS